MNTLSEPIVRAPPVPASETTALDVDDVSYAYGRRVALDHVRFTLDTGRFAVLFGVNGAGKTTLFSLLTRLYTARRGRIRVLGHDLARHPASALARLGVVFQQPTLDLDLTVMQNLHYHAALHGMSRADAAARGTEELRRIGLGDRAHDRVRSLSGGQRRRVELARALLHHPALLLLDEPTVGLDVQSRQDILDHVRGLCAERGLTALWATHLMDEATTADRLVVLHDGHVRFDGIVADALAAHGTDDIRTAFMTLIGQGKTNATGDGGA